MQEVTAFKLCGAMMALIVLLVLMVLNVSAEMICVAEGCLHRRIVLHGPQDGAVERVNNGIPKHASDVKEENNSSTDAVVDHVVKDSVVEKNVLTNTIHVRLAENSERARFGMWNLA
jgi:hypothetical protein